MIGEDIVVRGGRARRSVYDHIEDTKRRVDVGRKLLRERLGRVQMLLLQGENRLNVRRSALRALASLSTVG